MDHEEKTLNEKYGVIPSRNIPICSEYDLGYLRFWDDVLSPTDPLAFARGIRHHFVLEWEEMIFPIFELWHQHRYPKCNKKDSFSFSIEWLAVRRFVIEVTNEVSGKKNVCAARNCTQQIEEVDHILEKTDFPQWKLDPHNLQPLCKPHHVGKQLRQDLRSRALRKELRGFSFATFKSYCKSSDFPNEAFQMWFRWIFRFTERSTLERWYRQANRSAKTPAWCSNACDEMKLLGRLIEIASSESQHPFYFSCTDLEQLSNGRISKNVWYNLLQDCRNSGHLEVISRYAPNRRCTTFKYHPMPRRCVVCGAILYQAKNDDPGLATGKPVAPTANTCSDRCRKSKSRRKDQVA